MQQHDVAGPLTLRGGALQDVLAQQYVQEDDLDSLFFARPGDDGDAAAEYGIPCFLQREGPAPGEAYEDSVEVRAENRGVGREAPLLLPRAWERHLAPGSVGFWGLEHEQGVNSLGFARLASDPGVEVMFQSMWLRHPLARRQLAMLEILSETGYAPRVIDSTDAHESFLLLESTGTRSLRTLCGESRAVSHPNDDVLVPLNKALPLMVDLLRAAEAMERLGVAHGTLSETSIMVLDGDTHAMFPDLRGASVLRSAAGDVSPHTAPSWHRGMIGREAPEMEDGRPNSVANNVWQLGLVFSRMLFDIALPGEQPDEADANVRIAIRAYVRQHSDIEKSERFLRFQSEHPDIAEVVRGMLKKDPAGRMGPQEAMQKTMAAAEARGITIGPPRQPQEFPAELVEAFPRLSGGPSRY